MLVASLLMFCRITIAFLFLFSFGRKVLAFRDFAVTVSDFELFPRRWSKTIAGFFLGGEIATAILVIFGGNMLFLGLILAIVLLAAFSVALGTALWRNINMSCNCFGRTERRISHYDVVRNGLLILCSLAGLWMLSSASQRLSVGEIILLALMSAVFLLLITNLDDIVETLRRPFPVFEERR
jgi:hypothetical protein